VIVPDGLNGGETISPLTVDDTRPVPTLELLSEREIDRALEILETVPE
jgi:hypothetical protein